MKINFIYAPDVSYEQMIGYEIASIIWGKLFTDDVEVNILAKTTDQLNSNVIGGAIPKFHEQHYALFLQYYEADITSIEDQMAFNALQQGNTIDFLLDGDLVGGNTKLKLTTALAKALGMNKAISLDRYVLDESENLLDGTIMMNQDFAWDFNYLRNSEAAADTLDFMSVALHETGHILGFTSSLDFSLQKETLHSGRTELSNFSPLDLFRFSAGSLAQDNPDGAVNDLSIGGVAWFSPDGGETLSAKMSTGKEGDGFQASHWERRYDPLGIMDPTLWYQERVSITDLDVLAFDLMGYDLSSQAADVEQLFESENLEVLLAQAKVQLANKMGFSVQYLEDNANVPLSDLELIGEMETAYLAAAKGTANTSNIEDSSGSSDSDLESLDDKELKDFFKDLNQMMRHSYEWWAQNNGGGSSSWQELYEWWAQNNGGGSSSWQELYEWWAQNNGGGSGAWQELYEWWAQDNGRGSSWWQEVFFASQDDGNLDDIKLPGESHETANSPVYYQMFKGGHEDDIISGDTSDDQIKAGQGDDLIDGAEGNDTIFGNAGFDTIFGFDGNDSIMGSDGDDVISGESDNDVLFGESGADVLMGGDHDDYLDGGAGRDFLSGDAGDDVLIGGAGDDALEGATGKDLLVAGAGEDIGNGGSGDDFIYGDEYSGSLQQDFGNNLANLTNAFNPTAAKETPVEDNTVSDITDDVVLAQDPLRVEAEDMSWSGKYKVKNKSFASGGSLIQYDDEDKWFSGSMNFSGQAGTYNIIIGYHDIEEANGQIIVELNGTSIASWNLTKNIGEEIGAGNFTTHTINNIPLTVNDSLNLQSIINYDDEGGEGSIDYIEFVPVVDNGPNSNNTDVILGQEPIIIEAENMNLSGGYYQDNYYYNGTVIRTSYSNPDGFASQAFTGEAGHYQVKVHYIDESDGNASLSVKIANTEIDNWVLNQNTSGSNQEHSRTISEGMHIDVNAEIEIQGQAEHYEFARVDYIEFIPIDLPQDDSTDDSNDSSPADVDTPPETINITPELELGLNSDILRGGAGNDGIDGGKGNDIIFGENELNDSSNITAPLIDGALQYGHSVYILSQAGTWQEAQKEAKSYGGNLVTINDDGENIWLQNTFNTDESFWIGFSDSEQEGVWKWASGQSNTYTNWFHSEPNNSGNSQNYAVLNYYSNDGKWDDRHSSLDGLQRGIIEIDWSSVGGNDTILGGAGDDQVYGNSGNDIIFGDNGVTIPKTPGILTFQQGVHGYTGTVDTSLEEDFVNTNNSGAMSLNVDTNSEAHSLIKFEDIFGSQSGQISLDDTINSAFLEINVSNTGNNIEVHEMLQSWSDTATWNSMNKGIKADGTEAAKVPFVNVQASSTGILTIDVTASLQAWQANPNTNQGWALLPTGSNGVDFDSAEGNIAPRLVVDVNQGNSSELNTNNTVGGNDNIFGNGGHDIIRGGAGNDVINGTDGIVAGYLEKDTLEGGAGADKFILGDENQAFYATDGAQDYAVIQDFNASEDIVQLNGVAGDYQQTQQGNDLHLTRNGDLVVILENNNTLNLNSSAFEYVSTV
ncbi:putative calcium-binding protein [Xenococcus sp. PCC 7305]|uniref:NF038122 family metalloprotease n=1 Tax=Xenococcus sp. PCC 7305 TaxID=102125 RepID=UPI0002ACFA41|nr:NF038122 family metalloprotease [Xenococcus sp. PCC 7305]ELS05348.1 putative calcium-binding protein [Xenococcus sp. PCC 7305]